jgi:hypothetical protein
MRKIATVAAAAALTSGLVLAAPLAASANTVYYSSGYGSKTACLAEQHKPAYNNSFVHIVNSCWQNQFNHLWYFEYSHI